MEDKNNKQLQYILSSAAEALGWKKFEVLGEINCEKGNGALSEFFLASIKNPETQEEVNLAVKNAIQGTTRRSEFYVPQAFGNEIYFYGCLVPTLLKFKDSKLCTESFDYLPKYYCSSLNESEEFIVLENLSASGYANVPREKYFTPEQTEGILRSYAKHHALSFAFKDQHPEEYRELTKDIFNFWEKLMTNKGFLVLLKEACPKYFRLVDEDIRKACKDYIEKPEEIYLKASVYKGKYSCLLHGDCWSNNIMLKLEDTQLKGVKLVDFQGIYSGSPVQDLTYFLYSGCLIDVYGNIEKYHKVYYDMFSKVCRELGSDPDIVYPFEVFKDEWRQFAKQGTMMGILINKFKLLTKENIESISGDGEGFLEQVNKMKLPDDIEKLCVRRATELIEDSFKKGYLVDK